MEVNSSLSNTIHRKAVLKKSYEKEKLEAFTHYCRGRPWCVCCNELNVKFLSIDHLNNDGNKHRREVKFSNIYRWLKNNNYPGGFQILCMNCNCGKARNGGVCPHKDEITGYGDKYELWIR